MSELSIANVITISVAETPLGVSAFNTSNLAIFTAETPSPVFAAGYKIYLEPTEVGVDFGTSSVTYQMALAVFSQAPNILAGGGYLVVIPYLALETFAAAITRTVGLVQYFGAMSARIESGANQLLAAAVIQALNKMAFMVQRDPASIAPAGDLDDLRAGGFNQSRGLFYGAATDTPALLMMAAYAGRGLSVNFSGSNTTITMHLKDLATILPDSSMTQTLLNQAVAAGADTYPSIQGVSKVFTSGANKFFDQVYNLGAFVGALEVAGFNYLATTSTKIPQTEEGMDGLKGAYIAVCAQYIANQYGAPGTWTSPTTFGDQASLLSNIAQQGYYVFSAPVSQQLQVDRAARKAPLVQIALKEAGAIHSSNVIVNINA